MSTIVKKRVNLEFVNTGLQFEDIAVGNENQTLGEFIENTLMRLEVNYSMWLYQSGMYVTPHCPISSEQRFALGGTLMVCRY